MSGCGGECCGITHVHRVNWSAPKYHERVEKAREALRAAARVFPQSFTHNDIYHLMHDDFYARPEIASLAPWDQIHACPSSPWDVYVCEFLHSNGYIALLKRYPGAQQGRYVLTELGREFIA